MTGRASTPEPSPWKVVGTIAIAGVALVYREAARMLDERAGRVLARESAGAGRGATRVSVTAAR